MRVLVAEGPEELHRAPRLEGVAVHGAHLDGVVGLIDLRFEAELEDFFAGDDVHDGAGIELYEGAPGLGVRVPEPDDFVGGLLEGLLVMVRSDGE